MNTSLITTLSLVLMVTFATCSNGAPANQPDRPGNAGSGLGDEVRIKVGQEVRIEGEGGAEIFVRFVEVTGDSRGPEGVDCVWEGDAEAVFSRRAGEGEPATMTLHTAARYDREASAHGYTLRLAGLDPYPKEGKTIDPANYVATVVLTAGSSTSASSDR